MSHYSETMGWYEFLSHLHFIWHTRIRIQNWFKWGNWCVIILGFDNSLFHFSFHEFGNHYWSVLCTAAAYLTELSFLFCSYRNLSSKDMSQLYKHLKLWKHPYKDQPLNFTLKICKMRYSDSKLRDSIKSDKLANIYHQPYPGFYMFLQDSHTGA